MKHLLSLGAATIILLSACGEPDEDVKTPEDIDAEWAVEDAANAAADAEHRKWATSDARPVNLACMEPDYTRGQPDTYIGLNSPIYPSVQARSEALVQELRDLRPTTVQLTPAQDAAYKKINEKVSILTQFVFLSGMDNHPKGQVIACDFQNYEADQCTLMARVMGDKFAVENIVKDGEALSFTNVLTSEGTRTEVNMALKNADFDGVTMDVVEAGVSTLSGEWTRGKTGQEQTAGTLGTDQSFSYTENPDCSGQARWERPFDKSKNWVTTFNWTSVRGDDFALEYRDCRGGGDGAMVCVEGVL